VLLIEAAVEVAAPVVAASPVVMAWIGLVEFAESGAMSDAAPAEVLAASWAHPFL
jgi:hypothetical protein